MRRNVASQLISAQMIATADGSDVTSGTCNVAVEKDGAAGTGGTATHIANGKWEYAPIQGDTDAAYLTFQFVLTNAITVTVQVYTGFPQTVDNDVLNQSNETLLLDIPTVSEFNARTIVSASYALETSLFDWTTDAVANVTLCATTTALTNDAGITQAGADKVWGTTARILTANTNFNDISAADVNTQVVDVIFTDTITLLGKVAPAASPTLAYAMGYIYKMGRNRQVQSSTLYELYADDGTTVDQQATVSDDGTDAETAEVVVGA